MLFLFRGMKGADMASCDLVRVIRQQVDATGSVAATHVEQLLALVERLEGERQREHGQAVDR